MYSTDIHQAFLKNSYHSKTIPQYKIIYAWEIYLDLYLTYYYLNYQQNGLSVGYIKIKCVIEEGRKDLLVTSGKSAELLV